MVNQGQGGVQGSARALETQTQQAGQQPPFTSHNCLCLSRFYRALMHQRVINPYFTIALQGCNGLGDMHRKEKMFAHILTETKEYQRWNLWLSNAVIRFCGRHMADEQYVKGWMSTKSGFQLCDLDIENTNTVREVDERHGDTPKPVQYASRWSVEHMLFLTKNFQIISGKCPKTADAMIWLLFKGWKTKKRRMKS